MQNKLAPNKPTNKSLNKPFSSIISFFLGKNCNKDNSMDKNEMVLIVSLIIAFGWFVSIAKMLNLWRCRGRLQTVLKLR